MMLHLTLRPLLPLLVALTAGACIAATPPATMSSVAAPRVFQSSGDALADARRRVLDSDPSIAHAVATLRTDADKSLKDGPFTIVNKQHPRPGVDVHDYVSLA